MRGRPVVTSILVRRPVQPSKRHRRNDALALGRGCRALGEGLDALDWYRRTRPSALVTDRPLPFDLWQVHSVAALGRQALRSAHRASFGDTTDVPDDGAGAEGNRVFGCRDTRFRIVPVRRLCVRKPVDKFPRAVEQRLVQVSPVFVFGPWQ